MTGTGRVRELVAANRTPIALWTAGSLAAAVGLYFAVTWAHAQYLAWWAAADGFAHFQVWAMVVGVILATIGRLCGLSWGWTIALAVALPLVVGLLVLRAGFRVAGAAASTFD